MSAVIDLASLPTPEVIETLDYEAIVSRQKATFQSLWEAVRASNPDLGLPEYDVSMLQTDPVMVVLQAESYREMLLRARVNDAARSNLLNYSTGNDLVNLAGDHGVTPLDGETEDQVKQRIVVHDQGSSAAGPEEWYAYHARSVSASVREVAVYRSGTGPEIEIAITSTDPGGVPSGALLAAVSAAVNSEDIRGLNDIVTVVSGVTVTQSVEADVWLLPDTPIAVFDGLSAVVLAAWTAEAGIGFDLNPSWLYAKLSPAGVAKVNLLSPIAPVVADEKSAIAIDLKLNFKGRTR